MGKEELNTRTQEYESTYLKNNEMPPARFGKSLYIRQEHHERISQIVSVIGKGKINISEYVDNVISEHFDRHFEEIAHLFNTRKMY